MADIGLNPPFSSNLHSRTCVMKDALAQFGSIVVNSGSDYHAAAATTASAGATGIIGVVQSQGDPNNSGLFAINDEVTVRDLGDAQVLVLGGTQYARGNLILTSTTAGVGKKRLSETTCDVLGYCLQDITTGTNPQLISVRLDPFRIA